MPYMYHHDHHHGDNEAATGTYPSSITIMNSVSLRQPVLVNYTEIVMTRMPLVVVGGMGRCDKQGSGRDMTNTPSLNRGVTRVTQGPLKDAGLAWSCNVQQHSVHSCIRPLWCAPLGHTFVCGAFQK